MLRWWNGFWTWWNAPWDELVALEEISTLLCQSVAAQEKTNELLTAQNSSRDRTNVLLWGIQQQGEKVLTTLDDLIAEATDEKTVIQSMITLLDNLETELHLAGNDQTKLDQLKSLISNNKAAIASAVTANTPAANSPSNPMPISATNTGSTSSAASETGQQSLPAASVSTDPAGPTVPVESGSP